MSSELDILIQLGHDILSSKYYWVSSCTLLFYDHLLTLADEIKYAWSGRKSWTFWLFLFNRYFPMTLQFLRLATDFSPHFNQPVCDRSYWYSFVVYIVCTLLAQAVLTLRIYAVTSKNILALIVFATVAISQFFVALGIFVHGTKGAQTLPPIPLDAYRVCVFVQGISAEIIYTGISISYDVLAFSIIVFYAKKSKTPGLRIPTILDSIAKDATWYFLVVFSSHFILLMTLKLARPSLQFVPAIGILVYLPLMVSRIMLSLKKAADSSRNAWSLVEPVPRPQIIKFSRPQRSETWEEDGMSLDTFREAA